MIYLDNAATTIICNEALTIYNKASEELFYNPSAVYTSAISSSRAINSCRETIKQILGANSGDVIFTGSATEANNLAILGSVKKSYKKILCSQGEHPSVYNVYKHLSENGYDVDYIPLQANGEIDYNYLENYIKNNIVSFISIMFVNNETGAINDLAKISKILKLSANKILFHIDAVQGFCKIPLNILNCDADFVSISAHKINGPKGVGALYVKNINALKPIIYGGGQEKDKRSSTENTPAICAFESAIQQINIINNFKYVSTLKKAFLNNISILNENVICNTFENNSPFIISLTFKNVRGETMVHALEKQELCIGTGSACSSKKAGNRTLLAMGLNSNDIINSVRISFSRFTTIEEVNLASNLIIKTYLELKEKLK